MRQRRQPLVECQRIPLIGQNHHETPVRRHGSCGSPVLSHESRKLEIRAMTNDVRELLNGSRQSTQPAVEELAASVIAAPTYVAETRLVVPVP